MAYDAAARRIRGDAAITNFRPGESLSLSGPARESLTGVISAWMTSQLWAQVKHPVHSSQKILQFTEGS